MGGLCHSGLCHPETGRDGGMEGEMGGGWEEVRMEVGTDGWREGGREGGREEVGMEGGREGGREEGREGGRERKQEISIHDI